MPAFDELAVVGVGLGAVHHTVHPVPMRRTEHLLGGNVGDELRPVFRHAGRPLPGGILRQTDDHIGAVGAGHVDAVQLPCVQPILACLGLGHMLLPCAHRVSGGDAADFKNQLPQLFHGLLFGQAWEHLHRPRRGRDGRHAPLHPVVHGVLIPRFEEIAAGQRYPVQLARVQTGQSLGVVGMDGQQAAAVRVLGVVQPATQLAGLEVAQVCLGGMLHVQPGEGVILPPNDDPLGPRLVPGADAGVAEVRHGHRAADDEILAGLHIDAHLDDEISVKLEISLVHGKWSFLFLYSILLLGK